MRSMTAGFLLIATLAGVARGQGNPQTREGFWISFGFGAGSLGCEGCNDRNSGIDGYVRLGGTVSQRLLIGGEAGGWSKKQNGVSASVGFVGPVILFYPDANGGFYLKGGIGLANAEISYGRWSGSETGAGLTLGLGWDARVSRGFALTPYFSLTSDNFDEGTLNTVGFGLGFTWP